LALATAGWNGAPVLSNIAVVVAKLKLCCS
jgi:hypothetical protein